MRAKENDIDDGERDDHTGQSEAEHVAHVVSKHALARTRGGHDRAPRGLRIGFLAFLVVDTRVHASSPGRLDQVPLVRASDRALPAVEEAGRADPIINASWIAMFLAQFPNRLATEWNCGTNAVPAQEAGSCRQRNQEPG